MSPKNALSRTRYAFTKDRLQYFSLDRYACADCDHEYHPKIHSQPYVVQVGAILIGIGIFSVFLYNAPACLYALIPILIGGAMFWYRARDRRVFSAGGGETLRYGDVIFKCPKCGASGGKRTDG